MDTCVDHGVDEDIWATFKENVNVTIFTPASSKGIPLSINPLNFSPKNLDDDEMIRTADYLATLTSTILGYDIESDKGKAAKSYLYLLIEDIWRRFSMRTSEMQRSRIKMVISYWTWEKRLQEFSTE